jgi:hypothetical protein
MRRKQADKAVRAPEKSSRRTLIPKDCGAKTQNKQSIFTSVKRCFFASEAFAQEQERLLKILALKP